MKPLTFFVFVLFSGTFSDGLVTAHPTTFGLISVAGHFRVILDNRCDGPGMLMWASVYVSGQGIKTSFGDGITDSGAIFPGISSGYHKVNHAYNSTGIYTVKHWLYSGATLIDSLTYPYNYVFCRTLPVELYFDTNGNCAEDVAEPVNGSVTKAVVDSNGVTIDTLPVTSGLNYFAYGNPGDVYTVRVLPNPGHVAIACPSTGTIMDTLRATSVNAVKYVGLSGAPGTSFDFGVTGTATAGIHRVEADIVLSNGFCNPVAAIFTMHVSPKYHFWFSDPLPVTASGDSATWHVSGLSAESPVPARIHASWDVLSSPTVPIGDTVFSSYSIGPVAGDTNPANNSAVRIDIVRSGFDPNYIEVTPRCMPAGSGVTDLQYTIHFENTGNDTAHNIYVMDTLPALVTASSIDIVSASAKMYLSTFKDDNGNNILKFNFPGINLLDSSHHGQCTGMVVFKIKSVASIVTGNVIENHAGIYFDDNLVVLTDTSHVVKGCPVSGLPVESGSVTADIYPNPAMGDFVIRSDMGAFASYAISNSLGQVLIQKPLAGPETKVDASQLPAGIYYVMVRGEGGSVVRKVVKE